MAPQKQRVSTHYVVGSVWMFYWLSNIHVWLQDTVPLLANYYVVVALFLLYSAVSQPTQVVQFLTRPGIWIWVITAIVPMLMYLNLDRPSSFNYSEVRTRITMLSIVAGTGLVLNSPEGGRILRRSAGLALLVGVLINFSELVITNPYNSATAGGRAAGLYGDANISANAICAILLLSVDITKQSLRGLVVVGFGLLAVLITLSRSGIAFGAILAFGYLFFPRGRNTLPVGNRLVIAFVGLFMMVLAVAFAVMVLDFDTREGWRIRSMLSLDISDSSAQGRLEFLYFAIEQMQKNLLLGRGPGEALGHHLVAHNTYVTIGYEYGLIGLSVYVGLIGWGLVKVLAHGWNRAATYGMLTASLAFYSMFAHDVFAHPITAAILGIFLSNAAFSEPDDEGGSGSARAAQVLPLHHQPSSPATGPALRGGMAVE